MPTFTRAYAAHSATSPLAPYSFERRDLRPDDVAIDILYCGICHTDVHYVHNDWGRTRYPVVPGHEIVGRVTAVGTEVKDFKAGDVVGVGCMVDSCQRCEACAVGLEQYCVEGATFTYNNLDRQDKSVTKGGYSERIVVSRRFVLRVPENLDLKATAPLLCAGITVYSPLRHWKANKGKKVAIVGLGGLGHMALKFAKAFGAEVSLFTRTAEKESEARRLGADRVVLSTDPEQMKASTRRFDLIVDTVPVEHDINPYLATLKRDGSYVIVGQLSPLMPPLNAGALVSGRKSVAGSLIGGIQETQEMLDFCGRHNIVSDVEVINMDYVNTAYERMIKSDVRYRFVIDMQSLKAGAA